MAKKSMSEKIKEMTAGQKVFWTGFVLGFISTFTGMDRPNFSLWDFPLSGALIGLIFWLVYKVGYLIFDKPKK